MKLSDALTIVYPLHDLGAATSRRLHTGRDVAESPVSLCFECGEPCDESPCDACMDYARSGERDYDLDEGDR